MARSPRRRLHLSDAVAISRYIGEAADALLGIDIPVHDAFRFEPSDDKTSWAASILADRLAPHGRNREFSSARTRALHRRNS